MLPAASCITKHDRNRLKDSIDAKGENHDRQVHDSQYPAQAVCSADTLPSTLTLLAIGNLLLIASAKLQVPFWPGRSRYCATPNTRSLET